MNVSHTSLAQKWMWSSYCPRVGTNWWLYSRNRYTKYKNVPFAQRSSYPGHSYIREHFANRAALQETGYSYYCTTREVRFPRGCLALLCSKYCYHIEIRPCFVRPCVEHSVWTASNSSCFHHYRQDSVRTCRLRISGKNSQIMNLVFLRWEKQDKSFPKMEKTGNIVLQDGKNSTNCFRR